MPMEPMLPIIEQVVLPEVDNINDVTVTEPVIEDNVVVDDNNSPEELPLVEPAIPIVEEPLLDPFNQEIFADGEVKVYPVPSHGLVTVELGNLVNDYGSVQMTLVSISGRILFTKTINDNTVMIDLTGKPGVYIIRLATPAKTITKRILIQ